MRYHEFLSKDERNHKEWCFKIGDTVLYEGKERIVGDRHLNCAGEEKYTLQSDSGEAVFVVHLDEIQAVRDE